jgi:hypothetical protein
MLLALSLCVAVFLYAPLRNRVCTGAKKLHGRWRPSLADSLHQLLSSPQATEDPRAAIEQTMQWALDPAGLRIGQGLSDADAGRRLDSGS